MVAKFNEIRDECVCVFGWLYMFYKNFDFNMTPMLSFTGSLLTVELTDSNGQSVSQLICNKGLAKEKVVTLPPEDNRYKVHDWVEI